MDIFVKNGLVVFVTIPLMVLICRNTVFLKDEYVYGLRNRNHRNTVSDS